MTEEHRYPITEAAAAIAGWPQLWSRLLADHVAGPDGRCRACTSSTHIAPRWPCRLAELADAAQAMHRRAAAAPAPTAHGQPKPVPRAPYARRRPMPQ